MSRRRRKSHDPKPMVTIWPGGTAWNAWVRYWRANDLGNFAHFAEQQGFAQVPTQFPPGDHVDIEEYIACAKK